MNFCKESVLVYIDAAFARAFGEKKLASVGCCFFFFVAAAGAACVLPSVAETVFCFLKAEKLGIAAAALSVEAPSGDDAGVTAGDSAQAQQQLRLKS